MLDDLAASPTAATDAAARTGPPAGGLPDLPGHAFIALDGLWRRAGEDISRFLDPSVQAMRGSYGRLLDLVPDEGARPSDLADAGQISKQAVGPRLAELEALGWVRSDPDPSDRRARLVRRTAEGDRVRGAVHEAIAAMEASWAEQVGAERYATFRAVLDDLAADHRMGAVDVSRRA